MTLTLTSAAGERKTSHCCNFAQTLLSVELQFCYLAVTFLNASGGHFLLSWPPPIYTSPFSDLWTLLLSKVLGQFLALDRPSLLPSLPCCDSKERSFLLTVPCGARLCFLPHTVLSGCQPSVWLCDCCPKGECSFLPRWYCLLFSKHCSCTDMESQPQQGSSAPVCWQCLVEHLC